MTSAVTDASPAERGARVLRRLGRRARHLVRFANLLNVGLTVVSLAGVYAYFSRLLPKPHALGLIVAPAAVALVLLRPGWLVLAVLVVPPGVLAKIPNALLLALALLPLLGLFLRDGRVHLSWRSGMFPLLGLALLAWLHPTVDTGSGVSFAGGLQKLLAYYAVLGIATFDLVVRGELTARAVTWGLLTGAVLSTVLELGLSSSPGQGGGDLLTYGRSVANLAVMGIAVAGVRLLDPERSGRLRDRRWWNLSLLGLLGLMSALTLLRASWLAILVIVYLAARAAGKARWLWVLPLMAVLIFAIPTARERVFPGIPGEGLDLTEYTTGRWRLWTLAVEEIDPGDPVGRGWGHWWSLSPEELFGSSIAFVNQEDQEFVFPHNDALLITIDLGLVGLTLYLAYWLHVAWAFRSLLARPPPARRYGLMLLGAPVMFLMSSMVANGIALRGVAERTVIAAAVAFALHAHGTPRWMTGDDQSVESEVSGTGGLSSASALRT